MYWRIRPDNKYVWAVTHNLPYSAVDYLRLDDRRSSIGDDSVHYEYDHESIAQVPNIFPSSLFPVLIVDKFAFDCLKIFFSSSSSFLYHGTVGDTDVTFVAIRLKENGFDYQMSVYDRYNIPPPRNRISNVKKLILSDKFTSNEDIFRLGDEYGLEFELICSDIFKDRYESCGITGLRFIATN